MFSNGDYLDRAIDAAVTSKDIRADDLEFYRAAGGWAEVIQFESMDGYKKKFEDTASFFSDRIPEASQVCL